MTYTQSPHNLSLSILHTKTSSFVFITVPTNKITHLTFLINTNPLLIVSLFPPILSHTLPTLYLPIPLTPIPIPSFHDYILSTHKTSNKSTTSSTIFHYTSPSPSQLNNNIHHNTPIPITTTTTTQSPITNEEPIYHSDSSHDYSFLSFKTITK